MNKRLQAGVCYGNGGTENKEGHAKTQEPNAGPRQNLSEEQGAQDDLQDRKREPSNVVQLGLN